VSEFCAGWIQVKLPIVSEIIMGQSPPSSTYNKHGQGLPFFQGKTEFGKLYPVPVNYCSSPNKIAISGDILISVRAPVGPTNLCQERSAIGRGLAAIRPLGNIQSLYILFYLRSIEEHLSKQGTGSTFTAISKTDIEDIDILIAPLNEQRRIVAKLEKLLAKVDTCKQRLDKIPLILKRFRQSILTAACSGRLTADWREKNLNFTSLIEVLEENNVDDSSNLPSTWCLTSVGDVIENIKYGTSKKCDYALKGVPVLRIPNIGDGIIDSTGLKYTELSPKEFEELKLVPGDILVIRSNGSVSLVGKSAIIREAEKDFAYAGYLIRLRPNKSLIEPNYLNFCFLSSEVRLQIEIPARSTSGVNNINSNEVKQLKILIPPLEEQKEIVQRVETLFKIADQIEQRYQKARSYVDQLSQSILAKAFRGELVPQDLNDEPASVLLERIRAERDKEGKSEKAKVKSTGRRGGKAKQRLSEPIQLELPELDYSE